MRFTVKYLNRHTKEVYFRTVDADDLREAEKIAERMARKGFIVASIVQKNF